MTVRVKRVLGHSGREKHRSVSELYKCTWLLYAGLKYAMLPHTVAEPRCILDSGLSQVLDFQVSFKTLSVLFNSFK